MRALVIEHLYLRELCEGNMDGGGSFTGDLEGYVKEGSGNGLSVQGPGWGTWKRACILDSLKNEWRRTLETEHLSPWELYEGNWEGGLL